MATNCGTGVGRLQLRLEKPYSLACLEEATAAGRMAFMSSVEERERRWLLIRLE
jgi:hypothetical protein